MKRILLTMGLLFLITVEAGAMDEDTFKLDLKACESGHAHNCSNIGIIYGENQKFIKSRTFFKKACDKEDSLGCCGLATIYKYGLEVKTDIKKAKKLYKKGHKLAKKACDANKFSECISLASYYYSGVGVTVDMKKALEIYSKTCDDGIAEGCSKLGMMYYQGDETAVDKKKGKKLLSKACKDGYNIACQQIVSWRQQETRVFKIPELSAPY